MAKRDFEEYFAKITAQYQGLSQVYEDLCKDANEGMVEQGRVEQIKETLKPVTDSYNHLSYVKYLLDRPNKKSKKKRYDRANKKKLDKCGNMHGECVLKRNDEVVRMAKE